MLNRATQITPVSGSAGDKARGMWLRSPSLYLAERQFIVQG